MSPSDRSPGSSKILRRDDSLFCQMLTTSCKAARAPVLMHAHAWPHLAYTCARACARGKDVSCSDLNTIPAGRFLRDKPPISRFRFLSLVAWHASLTHRVCRGSHPSADGHTYARTRTYRHVHTCKPSADAATRHASRSRAMLARLARRHVCLAASGISVTVNYARMIRGGECSKGVG